MAKEKRISSKCYRCSLDCTVSREIALEKIPESQRKEFLAKTYPNEKPVYSTLNCSKKNKR